ncbi:hypothetical protein [Azospirillum sp.]|uniref:hypothetical protein n=1 Tax=Azospirillum sp. TaxID=34012 RepID=UPI003D74383E
MPRTAAPSAESAAGRPLLHAPTALVSGLLIVAAAQVALVLLGISPLAADGGWTQLYDADSYARVMRVEQMHDRGGWFDPLLGRLNAPYGQSLHWTHPVDLLLLAGAGLAGLMLSYHDALLRAAMLMGPLLHLLCVPALSAATRPFLNDRWFVGAVLLLALQVSGDVVFSAGAADHHGLLVLLLLATLAALLLHAVEPERRGPPVLAALAAAVALWTSVEGVLLAATAGVAVGLLWALYGPQRPRALLAYAAALAALLPLELLAERGPWGLGDLEVDRISAFHAALALASLVMVGVVDRAAARGVLTTPQRRLGALAVAGVAVAGVALAAFPGMLVHPYDGVDPLVTRLLTGAVQADRPLSVANWGERLAFVLDWGPFFPAAIFTALALRRRRGADARRHAVLALFLAVYLVSSVLAVREVPMLEAVCVIPWVEGLAALVPWCRAGHGRMRRLAGAGAFAASAAGYWAVAAAIAAPMGGAVALGAPRPCNYAEVAPFLTDSGATLMTNLFDGPEIAYRTGGAAVAGPYHRGADAILDTVRFFLGSDAEAREVARRRAVTHVLLCRSTGAGVERLMGGQPRGVLARLWIDRPPVWLRPLPLPAPLARRYMAYRVLPD